MSFLAPRFVDRGAITAAYVGIGMAVTIAISFLLIIPIEPIVWLFALPSGMLIGYYANQRSNRRAGPWGRILVNGLFAAALTGLTLVAMSLGVRALFFFADNGYRDPGLGGPLTCSPGADCVYQRYLDLGRGPEMTTAGIDDVAEFTTFYWGDAATKAGVVAVVTLLGGVIGAGLYGLTQARSSATSAGGSRRVDASSVAADPHGGAGPDPIADSSDTAT